MCCELVNFILKRELIHKSHVGKIKAVKECLYV